MAAPWPLALDPAFLLEHAPEEHRRALAKTDPTLAETDRVIAKGVRFGHVLADAS